MRVDPIHSPTGSAVHRCRDPETQARQTIQQQQPGGKSDAYGETLKRIGRPEVMLDAVAYELAYCAIMIALCWTGFALEAALP